jgi:hypothetical protein
MLFYSGVLPYLTGPSFNGLTFACTLARLLHFKLHRPGVTQLWLSWKWEQDLSTEPQMLVQFFAGFFFSGKETNPLG